MAERQREVWVDNVKVFACMFVVLGHFFQSMVKSEILPESSFLQWFDQAIYCFHVQLFFVCSGYLYQRFTLVNSRSSWKNNVWKKTIALGVPYVTFSMITWGMKAVFSGMVNSEEAGLFTVLFLEPMPPYWYLHTLFLCFLITPTLKKGTMPAAVVLALLEKVFAVSGLATEIGVPYVIRNLFSNEIWFLAGMVSALSARKKQGSQIRHLFGGALAIAVFIGTDIFLFRTENTDRWSEFLLGIVACAGISLLIKGWFWKNKQNPVWGIAAKYTMPVFLMHTIFAAGLRSALFKMGIENAAVHVTAGLLITFAGPVIAMVIMEKMKWPVFLIYPERKQKE